MRHRKIPAECVPIWGVGDKDGVVLVLTAFPPTIQDDQQNPAIFAPVTGAHERRARHGCMFFDAHDGQNSRGYVLQTAIGEMDLILCFGIDHDEGHRVGSMRHVGLAFRGEQHFKVAVIGGDERNIAFRSGNLNDPREVLIHSLRTSNFCRGVAGVPNHISISEVGDDAVNTLVQPVDDFIGNSGQA